ncbi:hypothetical protein L3Q72_20300 [Vibrio sp. JC009]|uniref:hypothetical protein n=1 Tax=Vibrio sp. JC009 TaxID=2912314 RepID=UPI0023B142D5|nr:hypothetical protein [Vibrio sp. JC009]WED23581.1 hypothetical protein L3Q72_20300 [Vibrio sp. JC009]
MKRNSKSYRLQLIKESALRHERRCSSDPMVRHIETLIEEHSSSDTETNPQNRFAGHHYDERIDGWVSDKWSQIK